MPKRVLPLCVLMTAACGTSGRFDTDASSPRYDAGAVQDGFSFGDGSSPHTLCDAPAKRVDTSAPTTVVGTSSVTCTEAALRAAIAIGGIVTWNCGIAKVIVLNEIDITADVVLDGANLITLSGASKTRIFHVMSGVHVVLQNLTLVDGESSDSGGAILDEGASLTVIGCAFGNHHAAVGGGAIASRGTGTLTISESTFDSNTSTIGGAISVQNESAMIFNSVAIRNRANGVGHGGALAVEGSGLSVSLCGDLFGSNQALDSGGAFFGAGNAQLLNVSVDRTTFDANGIDVFTGNGAGMFLTFAGLTVTRSTFSHNIGNVGGALRFDPPGTASFENTTIGDNHASRGGGLWLGPQVVTSVRSCTIATNVGGGIAAAGNVTLDDTIIAGNTADLVDGTTNCANTYDSAAPDLEFPIDAGACTTSIAFADPLLGPLSDNGSPVTTMKPASTSPAIGAGTNCPATDALGKPRPTPCTLGAMEP